MLSRLGWNCMVRRPGQLQPWASEKRCAREKKDERGEGGKPDVTPVTSRASTPLLTSAGPSHLRPSPPTCFHLLASCSISSNPLSLPPMFLCLLAGSLISSLPHLGNERDDRGVACQQGCHVGVLLARRVLITSGAERSQLGLPSVRSCTRSLSPGSCLSLCLGQLSGEELRPLAEELRIPGVGPRPPALDVLHSCAQRQTDNTGHGEQPWRALGVGR